jgi:hypothetical protein
MGTWPHHRRSSHYPPILTVLRTGPVVVTEVLADVFPQTATGPLIPHILGVAPVATVADRD